MVCDFLAVWKPLCEQLDNGGFDLVAVDENLIDEVWENRPARPANPVILQPLTYSGKSQQL